MDWGAKLIRWLNTTDPYEAERQDPLGAFRQAALGLGLFLVLWLGLAAMSAAGS
jgi:hypothetical protein